ncbi:MAG: class I SAM-dependent methyltransferase [Actinomycetota bacterium]
MDRELWDREAAAFDDAPDHGLADPSIREAWRQLLLPVLPPAPARIADLGCGTGTLTALLTAAGHGVDGLDLSPEMIRRAAAKVPSARFAVGDAQVPDLPAAEYDAVLSRHVLWAMDDPVLAIERWAALLRPGGILVLVEGRWSTGAGLTADEAGAIVRRSRTRVDVRPLVEERLWGGPITDERYLLVSPS